MASTYLFIIPNYKSNMLIISKTGNRGNAIKESISHILPYFIVEIDHQTQAVDLAATRHMQLFKLVLNYLLINQIKGSAHWCVACGQGEEHIVPSQQGLRDSTVCVLLSVLRICPVPQHWQRLLLCI